MKPQVILVVTLAVLGVLAALPVFGEAAGSWPCCDDCGICNRMMPPKCRCNDISEQGCHPECKKCVMSSDTLTADGDGIQKHAAGSHPGPVYRCADMVTNFCKRRCTPEPAAEAILSEVVF